ncbi:MAG: 30S ribosomal protein S12 methylthiotransferase RimO [Deltaproteobacteria bacterium]|nr:30S ribosomal protein S12 methylthiotransferase RimO [Deltaproteobacteria bacterium]
MVELKEKIYLESLGCSKNLVDSEVIAGCLRKSGYTFTTSKEEAAIIIVNTCAFIKDATQEAIDTILKLATLKKEGTCRKLVVAGCLPQRYGKQLIKKLKDVDLFVGVGEFPKIGELLKEERVEHSLPALYIRTPTFLLDHNTPRILSTPNHTAYVKIAEGCSHRCSFCTIPTIKGPYQSRPPESIITEVKNLAGKGTKEINLIAQDTTFYGKDLTNKKDLAYLLKQLSKIESIEWIRMLYCHPDHFSHDLINTIKEEEKICNYIDLPLQHISDDILKRMGRSKDSTKIRKLIKEIRENIPNLWIRTTFMVGFPGETEKDFNILMDFAREVEFEHLGAFRYSNEEGTKAYRLKGKVPAHVIEERYHTLMSLQSNISLKKNQRLIGSLQRVLIEGINEENDMLLGRTFFQAPDIDGIVYVAEGEAAIGEMVEVRITDASEYDLFGEILQV